MTDTIIHSDTFNKSTQITFANETISKMSSKPQGNYTTITKALLTKRFLLKSKYEKATSDSSRMPIINEAKLLITETIIDSLIPFWYGTKWAFEGYTNIPHEGEVACGYFVSTVLKHAGFNLNRYKLAQKDPWQEAVSINLTDSIQILENVSFKEICEQFHGKDDGLYFVGLDYHVGFLLKKKDVLFFIHSNYINAAGVMIEIAEHSQAFRSTAYYIGNITTNNNLIRKWILNSKIEIL
jgi:hypothetical protein